MHAEKSNFTVSRMARLLEVSRSGFYAWLTRAPSPRALRAERIEAKIAWLHGESDEVFGSPRILVDLREDGEIISRKTVATPYVSGWSETSRGPSRSPWIAAFVGRDWRHQREQQQASPFPRS